ncbi:MAG: tetratricopeptide repeat protein, partial [Nitrosomonas sp.]|uniref:CHAT domain-containing tetratricopeptide repeat protein n=1 Tax=Nitrosomonas sp. TaxID=42353 RepID=UPI0032EFC3AA
MKTSRIFFAGILLWLAVTAAFAQNDEWERLNNEAFSHYQQGRYTEALSLAQQALEVAEKTLGPEHPDTATSLLAIGLLYDELGELDKVEPFYQRALSIREKALDPEHPDMAQSLHNLASLYDAQGQYTKAELLFERALAIREKVLGPEHPDVALSLGNLGLLYQNQGQYSKAEPLFKRALAIYEKNFGPEHLDIAAMLGTFATLYDDQGQYNKAESLIQRALTIFEKSLGPEHSEVATNLNNLALIYRKQAKFSKAQPLLERAFAISEKSLGPEHPKVASSLNNLAGLYEDQGQYAKAQSLYERALAIKEKVLGPEHPDVANSLNSLALFYKGQDQYAKAEPLYKRALIIWEKSLGPEHPAMAKSLNNLAGFYRDQGQYAKALPLYERALAIKEKVLGPEHPDVANSLNNLALFYKGQDQYVKAEPLYKRALTILEQSLGPEHPAMATSLNNLAGLYHDQGQYAKALPLCERALAIEEKALGSEHPDVAGSLNNLAILYSDQGQYDKAQLLHKRALAILEKSLGPEHSDVALSLQNAALNLWTQGGTVDMSRALELFERANTIREHHLKLMMAKGSEQDKRDYMATIEKDPYTMITFHRALPDNTQAARLALTTVLQHKGRLLDAVTQSVMTLRQRMNPEDQALLDQLETINGERSDLFNRVQHGKIDRDTYAKRNKELETQADVLEAKISARSAEFATETKSITLAAVQRAIPQDAVLVEYLRYQPFNPKASEKKDKYGPARYIVYLLRASDDPVSVELGDAAAIDPLVEQFRKALANPHGGAVHAVARKLDAAIMQPVRAVLGDTKTVLISPDGALNLIPFAALQDEQNRYLVENYRVTYVSSGRDLLRLDVHIDSTQPPVFFAGVDFGTLSGKDATATRAASNSKRASDYQQQFTALPGTRAEAEAIRKILPTATLFSGQDANETTLKKLDRPRILHLATHGFFLADLPESAGPSRGVSLMGVSETKSKPVHPATTENPLLRSGLALANANQLQSGDED